MESGNGVNKNQNNSEQTVDDPMDGNQVNESNQHP
jgi:hypothetical protein